MGLGNVNIKVSIKPSFEAHQTFELKRIQSDDHSKKYQVAAWIGGGNCFSQIIESIHEVDTQAVENALHTLMQTSIAIMPAFAMGLDGTTYTIEINNGFNAVTYTWWGQLPEQWENLRGILELVVGEFKG